MLMPATHFSLGAAAAGLRPAPGLLLYPKEAAFTRIVLQQLLPSPVIIRLATMDDLPTLIRIEEHWGAEELRASEATLRLRLTNHPGGQFVAERGGEVCGAMYTQRVETADELLTAQRATELQLHSPRGPVVQLLGVSSGSAVAVQWQCSSSAVVGRSDSAVAVQ